MAGFNTNILSFFSNKFFMKGRKLKPLIKETPAINMEAVKECKIVVHVIKAENVPIRNDIIQQYQVADLNKNPGSRR